MDGSSALLINIIQLTVLVVAMGAAIKYAQTSNQAVKALSSGGKGLFSKFGGEKLTDKIRNKTGETAKKRAAFAGANMSAKLQDPNTAAGRYTSGVLGRAKNFRRQGAAKSQARELALKSRQEERDTDVRDRMGKIIGSTAGTHATPSRFADAAVAVGGDKVTGYAARIGDEEFRKRVTGLEAEFKLSGKSEIEMAAIISKAIREGDRETATAAINHTSSMGAPGTEAVHQALSSTTAANQETQTAVMNAVYSNDLTKSADIVKGGYDASGNFTSNFHSLSPEQVASLAPPALARYQAEITTLHAANPTDAKVLRAKDIAAAIQANEILNAKAADPRAQNALNAINSL